MLPSRRPHSSLGHLPPSEFSSQRQDKQTAEEVLYSRYELPRKGANVGRENFSGDRVSLTGEITTEYLWHDKLLLG